MGGRAPCVCRSTARELCRHEANRALKIGDGRAETQRLSPEQRLEAFLDHSRLLAELHLVAERLRNSKAQRQTG
jgi:hypothetical protein